MKVLHLSLNYLSELTENSVNTSKMRKTVSRSVLKKAYTKISLSEIFISREKEDDSLIHSLRPGLSLGTHPK